MYWQLFVTQNNMAKDKVGQQLRREIRSYARQQFTLIEEIIRQRPKYFPRWLWQFGANIFIDVKKLEEFYTKGVDMNRRK